jgi:predicted anti-sigma-YlaC factor YlaD
MHLLGDLSIEETTGLFAHLEGCAECRAIANEMTETVAMLGLVDRASVEPTAQVSPELSDKVLGNLRRSSLGQRRSRTARYVTFGVIGAVAAALVLIVAFSTKSVVTPPERTLALRGATSVTASAVLVAQPWGTSLQLHEHGLPGDQVYTVSMETSSGTWWTAGTYRAMNDKTVSATMACAVAWRKITGIRVENASGVTVLTSYAAGSTPTYQ